METNLTCYSYYLKIEFIKQMSHFNSFHISTLCFFKIHFNIIILSMPTSSKWFLPTFQLKEIYAYLISPCKLHVSVIMYELLFPSTYEFFSHRLIVTQSSNEILFKLKATTIKNLLFPDFLDVLSYYTPIHSSVSSKSEHGWYLISYVRIHADVLNSKCAWDYI
jgi:hypothetical protein